MTPGRTSNARSALGLTLLVAALGRAWSLHAGGRSRRLRRQSRAWRDDLRYLARLAREECLAGLAGECLNTSQRLQDHVWEHLQEDAAALHIDGVQKPVISVTRGNGVHVRLPACANGSDTQEVPQLFYRHIPKAAGYNILSNLREFAGLTNRGLGPKENDYSVFAKERAAHPNSTFAFTYTRNPITRFISGYTELETVDQAGVNVSAKGSRARALEFVKNVARGFHKYQVLPQVCFHLYHYRRSGMPFDFIGRLEDFQDGWRHLQDLSNCSGKLPAWSRRLGRHPSQDDPDGTTVAMKDVVPDPHPASWRELGVDPHDGYEDSLSLLTTGREATAATSMAMRDLLLAPDRHALRLLCALFAMDFYVMSYPFPVGCEHLSVGERGSA